MPGTVQRVAVIGASDDPERYSNRAIRSLLEHGHTVFPVTPKEIELPGLKVYASIREVPLPLQTVTLYVGPKVLVSLVDDIMAARPERVIFNPGTEEPATEQRLRDIGIEVVKACTLVLLGTGQFS